MTMNTLRTDPKTQIVRMVEFVKLEDEVVRLFLQHDVGVAGIMVARMCRDLPPVCAQLLQLRFHELLLDSYATPHRPSEGLPATHRGPAERLSAYAHES